MDSTIAAAYLTWDMKSGSQYASVDSSGKVSGNNAGSAVVRATGKSGTDYSGLSGTSDVTVNAAPSDVAITSADIYQDGYSVTQRITLLQGRSINLDAHYEPSDATIHSYKWTSGSALITLTYSTSATCTVRGSSINTGDVTLTLEIEDTLGNKKTDSITIRVTDRDD